MRATTLLNYLSEHRTSASQCPAELGAPMDGGTSAVRQDSPGRAVAVGVGRSLQRSLPDTHPSFGMFCPQGIL